MVCNLRFANQAGIIRWWLKLQLNQLYLKNLLFRKNCEECNPLHLVISLYFQKQFL